MKCEVNRVTPNTRNMLVNARQELTLELSPCSPEDVVALPRLNSEQSFNKGVNCSGNESEPI